VTHCSARCARGRLKSTPLAFLANPHLKNKIEAYLTAASTAEEPAELVAAGEQKPRDFQKEVHTWNPTLPMWRRSPKE